jgi:hypothetical protein
MQRASRAKPDVLRLLGFHKHTEFRLCVAEGKGGPGECSMHRLIHSTCSLTVEGHLAVLGGCPLFGSGCGGPP